MGSSFANLTRWLLIAGVALAVAYTAGAQHAGQAILFSSADNDNVSSNMPSLAAKPPGLLDFAGEVQSPGSKFDAGSETEPHPPAISPARAQRRQRLLDERKNWALLTPAEILGLPTQEKILGIPERDAFGQPKNETVIAKYYDRQEQLRARTNDDNYGAADTTPRLDFSGSQELQMNQGIWAPAGSKPGNSPLMDQFFSGTSDNRSAPAQVPERGWSSKAFSLPAPPPKATPEQQAAMEQFRQLLQPRSPSGSAAKTPALGSPIFTTSSSIAPGPAPGQFLGIPIGASFTPLNSGIAMPVGVTPLPGLLGQNNTGLPALAPEWKPQQAPWMSSAPQLGAIPQRKF